MQDALKQHQIQLEVLFNKNELLPRIRKEFLECDEFDFCKYIESIDVPVKFGIEVLTQMALHKRADLPTLVGCLQSMTTTPQVCADLLYKCMEGDLMDWHTSLEIFIVKFTLSAELQAELDLFQFPLPMVVPPREVQHNKQSGYLQSAGSIILRKNHHDDDVCLDHINRMNQIKLTLDQRVVDMVANKWRNLDKAKPGEKSEDFQRRKRAFDKYDRTSREVIKLITGISPVFYLTHKYDKRGRTYCQGYHVTYQGAAWNKAVINFDHKEMVE